LFAVFAFWIKRLISFSKEDLAIAGWGEISR